MVAGGSIALTAPANADSSRCSESGWFCVWSDASYGGNFGGTSAAEPSWNDLFGIFRFGIGSMNDNDSSVWNRWDTRAAAIYKDSDYKGGVVICTDRGAARSSYTSVDDQGSSHKAANSTARC